MKLSNNKLTALTKAKPRQVVLAGSMGLILSGVFCHFIIPTDSASQGSVDPSASVGARQGDQYEPEIGFQNGPDDLKRKEEWVLGISPQSKNLLALAVRLESMSGEDFISFLRSSQGGLPVRDAILEEWARRDVSEMFESLWSDRGFPEEQRKLWLEKAISTWIVNDQEGAIQRLGELRESDLTSTIRGQAIAALKKEGQIEVVLDLESRWQARTWSLNTPHFAEWIVRNQRVAFKKIQNIRHPGKRKMYLKDAGIALASVGVDEVIKWSQGLSKDDQTHLMKGAVQTLVKDGYDEAIAMMENYVSDPEVFAAAEPAIALWMKDDPESAIAWAESHLVGKTRAKVIAKAQLAR